MRPSIKVLRLLCGPSGPIALLFHSTIGLDLWVLTPSEPFGIFPVEEPKLLRKAFSSDTALGIPLCHGLGGGGAGPESSN